MGKIDIDYQVLYNAFFKFQTKPNLTIHGDMCEGGLGSPPHTPTHSLRPTSPDRPPARPAPPSQLLRGQGV